MTDMMTWPREVLLVLAAFNFGLCSAIGYSCVCRFASMSRATTAARWRMRYVMVMLAASASGWSPVWGEWPGLGQISMALACLYVIGLTAHGWKQGPPSYARANGGAA